MWCLRNKNGRKELCYMPQAICTDMELGGKEGLRRYGVDLLFPYLLCGVIWGDGVFLYLSRPAGVSFIGTADEQARIYVDLLVDKSIFW
jgi:hypothetical protein